MYYNFLDTQRSNPHFTFEELLNGTCPQEGFKPEQKIKTVYLENEYTRKAFEKFVEPNIRPIYEPTDLTYRTFRIPKKSDPNKLRTINEPNPELKNFLRIVKTTIEDQYHFLPHNAAHAYIKGRSVLTALKVHQTNQSKWFLKLDVKDFFPNHTEDFIIRQMEKVYPFAEILKDTYNAAQLKRWVHLAMLDNGLPQGTPLSPLLTNISMVPVDATIQNLLNHENHYFIYTRYADDILISSRSKFNAERIVDLVERAFRINKTPFKLNREKTRFGSSNGRNWNLGIMLNKDNDMTIGFRNNKRLRAKLFSFFMDNTHLNPERHWNIMKLQQFMGLIAWYKSVQPEITNMYLEKYGNKFGTTYENVLRRLMAS